MTITEKQIHLENGYYVGLEVVTGYVTHYDVILVDRYGITENRNTYALENRKNAVATFNRYVRKAKEY